MNTELFNQFAPVLKSPSAPIIRDQRLLLEADGDVAVYYAPFEYINPEAKIVLVGITPGPTQMVNANNVARRVLLSGASSEEAIRSAKQEGAFSGKVMRSNLAHQLDHWGFHQWLGIKSASSLFDNAGHLAQTTSLLRYPVFVRDDDYRGTPNMMKHPLLRKFLLNHFVREVQEMENALFLALGPQVQRVLDQLCAEGVIDGNRLIRGLLHPSPNCTYRIDYLIGDRTKGVPVKTNPAPYDQGRKFFQERFLNA